MPDSSWFERARPLLQGLVVVALLVEALVFLGEWAGDVYAESLRARP